MNIYIIDIIYLTKAGFPLGLENREKIWSGNFFQKSADFQ